MIEESLHWPWMRVHLTTYYPASNIQSKYTKLTLTELKGETGKSAILHDDFNTIFSEIVGKNRKSARIQQTEQHYRPT